jgi:hypothetical protein
MKANKKRDRRIAELAIRCTQSGGRDKQSAMELTELMKGEGIGSTENHRIHRERIQPRRKLKGIETASFNQG